MTACPQRLAAARKAAALAIQVIGGFPGHWWGPPLGFAVGNSPAANLNWIGGKPTTISLTFTSSTANNDVTVQYSLDDLQRVPSTSVVWGSLSSGGITNSTTPFHFASTTWSDNAFTVQVLSPIAAVRMASSALGGGTATLKVTQGEAW
jgi:hypothetical protein